MADQVDAEGGDARIALFVGGILKILGAAVGAPVGLPKRRP